MECVIELLQLEYVAWNSQSSLSSDRGRRGCGWKDYLRVWFASSTVSLSVYLLIVFATILVDLSKEYIKLLLLLWSLVDIWL